MTKTFLSLSLALSIVALTGCAKKPAESNTPAPTTSGIQTVSADAGSKSCSMKKADGEMASKSCAKKTDGEMASKSCAKPAEGELASAAPHAGCPHAAGEACDHEAGAKAGRDCCKAHMAAATK